MKRGISRRIIFFVSGLVAFVGVFLFLIYKVSIRDSIPEISNAPSGEVEQLDAIKSSKYTTQDIDIKILSQSQAIGSGMYLFFQGERKDQFSNPEYVAYYYVNDRSLRIIVYGSPFEDIRKTAEKIFLEKLGISKEQACDMLNVRITASGDSDVNYVGRDIPLSFCE
jgi:hypothetical protein